MIIKLKSYTEQIVECGFLFLRVLFRFYFWLDFWLDWHWLWRFWNRIVHHWVLWLRLLHGKDFWLNWFRLLGLPCVFEVEVHLFLDNWRLCDLRVRLLSWTSTKQNVDVGFFVHRWWRRRCLSHWFRLFLSSIIAEHVEHSSIFFGICRWFNFSSAVVLSVDWIMSWDIATIATSTVASLAVWFFLKYLIRFGTINCLLFF